MPIGVFRNFADAGEGGDAYRLQVGKKKLQDRKNICVSEWLSLDRYRMSHKLPDVETESQQRGADRRQSTMTRYQKQYAPVYALPRQVP